MNNSPQRPDLDDLSAYDGDNDGADEPASPPVQARLAELADKLEALLLARVDLMTAAPEPPEVAELNTASHALWRLTAVRKTLLFFTEPAPSENEPRHGPRGITEEEIQELLDRWAPSEDDEEKFDNESDNRNSQFQAGPDPNLNPPPPAPPPAPSSPPHHLSVKSAFVSVCPSIPRLRPQSIRSLIRTIPLIPDPPPADSRQPRSRPSVAVGRQDALSYPRPSACLPGKESPLPPPRPRHRPPARIRPRGPAP